MPEFLNSDNDVGINLSNHGVVVLIGVSERRLSQILMDEWQEVYIIGDMLELIQKTLGRDNGNSLCEVERN